MEIHVLPFGKEAWDARSRILGGILAARPGPPHDFRDVLYLVPNERTVLGLRALLLGVLKEVAGAKGCIPPRISALNRFIESRAARAASRPVVDSMTRSLAMEELTREAAGRRKGLLVAPDALAPSMAPLIADALDTVYTYGLTDAALNSLARDSIAASLLADVKRAYEAWLDGHGLADPALAAAEYSAAQEEFGEYRTVVLDGFYDADPVELKFMKALSAAQDFRFVLEAPGLGLPGMTDEGMPYFGTDRLIEALGLTLPDSPDGRMDDEAAALSGALFGGRLLSESLADAERLKPLTRGITVAGSVNEVEEVHYIASTIKEAALSGGIEDLNRVAVFLPRPESYLPALKRAFGEMGIPFCESSGTRLIQSPVAAAVMRVLGVARDGYAFHAIRAVLCSPLIRLGEDGNHPEAFARFGRSEGITRGRRAWLDGLKGSEADSEDAQLALGPVSRMMELIDKLPDGRANLSRWCAATRDIIEGSCMRDAADQMSETEPELGAAIDGLTEALDGLESSGARLGSAMTLTRYLYVLRKTLSERRFSTYGRRFEGVRVLGALELLSEPFDVLFAAGLSEGSLPAGYSPELFFTGPSAAALGLPGKKEHGSREARRFLGLVMCAGRAHLVYPAAGGRGELSQSPYVRALRPFIEAGAVDRITKWCRPSEPSMALSPEGLIRALAMRAALPGGPDKDELARALGSLPPETPGLDRARAALAAERAPAPPSPSAKSEFSVTELDQYLLCHYRYYHDRVSGVSHPDDPEDDIAPHRAGSAIHEILGRFYEEAAGPITSENSEAELKRLRGIAAKKFSKLPDTLANRELARRFSEFLAPRFIETETRIAGSGYEPCGFEQQVRIEVQDSEAGSFVITGKIDRVELASDGGFVVADYKTGRYPAASELFQLPLYAHMLKESGTSLSGKAAQRPVGFVYYNLRDGSMRDVMLYESEAGVVGSESKPRRKAQPDVIEGRVQEAYKKAVEAVRGIRAGDFAPSCDKEHVCERCVYIEVCGKGGSLDEAQPAENGGDGGGGGDEN